MGTSLHISQKMSSKGATIPESLLKASRTRAKNAEAAAEAKKQAKKANSKRRAECFKRAEKYVKEYRMKEKSLIALRRTARNYGKIFVEPKTKKILQLLRLRQIHNGVFVKLNAASEQMLRLVTPYITFGTPSLRTVRELIYKRGYGKINKMRIPLTSNKLIEDSLGQYGMICLEDIVHEIFTVGPNFKKVANFLWPFKLSPPKGGVTGIIKHHFVEAGHAGDRGSINNLVKSMN